MPPLKPRGRVRCTLLVLLWIWAGCVFLVVDLFFNVDEFDEIRPRAPLYRAMREVAHEMIGEPWMDAVQPVAAVARGTRRDRTDDALPCRLRQERVALGSGARVPVLRDAMRERVFSDLLATAREGDDVARRAAATRSLARMFGSEAAEALRAIAQEPGLDTEVRAAAARSVQWTGDDAVGGLVALVRADLPEAVRLAAVRGLRESGCRAATALREISNDAALPEAVRMVAGESVPCDAKPAAGAGHATGPRRND